MIITRTQPTVFNNPTPPQAPVEVPDEQIRYAPKVDSWEVGGDTYNDTRDLLDANIQSGSATYHFREATVDEVYASAFGGAILGVMGGGLVAAFSSVGGWTAAAVGAAAGATLMGGLAGYELISNPPHSIDGKLSSYEGRTYFQADGMNEAVDLNEYSWADRRPTGATGRTQWWDTAKGE